MIEASRLAESLVRAPHRRGPLRSSQRQCCSQRGPWGAATVPIGTL